jgi:hypothetical protein
VVGVVVGVAVVVVVVVAVAVAVVVGVVVAVVVGVVVVRLEQSLNGGKIRPGSTADFREGVANGKLASF